MVPTWSSFGLQNSASPSMEQLTFFHDFTMVVITLITVTVGLNMFLICSCLLTNRLLLQEQVVEIVWTVIPVFILLSIALPSLKALYLLDDPFTPSLTIKAVGHQWYWSYEYSDFPGIEFDSYMLPESDSLSIARLLETDNSLIVPSFSQIRVLITGSDVIHSWAVPSLGVKADAVPGRLNQVMLYVNRSGVFYGQCSEICGANHSFMPIKLEAVPMAYFIKWALKSS
ncbi:cytochrome c oxidase subunit II (mitochondrion) [Hyalella azteca]|uniref:Cytochrome c oxidase subunit 2 n=1 Tax=Hyalella azteca TaxID=294128 RepID=A0A385UNZ6_HYAAZ|nr:cytochrome c oxidase subunit II [Hyalella azteca]AYB71617.1 cytochrome oxidase subunit 2 [Hyalella azteca]